jgi:sec-independent protein translocase protein TatA
MPGNIGWTGAVVIILVLLLVFGPKRLPEMGRSLGRGMREFKDSISGNDRDDDFDQGQLTPPTPQATGTAPVPPDAATPQPEPQTQPENERVSS